MNILAIDTSTEACSVALKYKDELTQEREIQPTGHSKLVLEMVSNILEKNDINLTQLDVIAVDTGPGSFTGVRIGLGVAQGLAYGSDLPVVGISSLQILAATVESGMVFPAIDARMNQIYCGLYEIKDEDNPKELHPPVVINPDDIPFSVTDHFCGIGSGWDKYEIDILSSIGYLESNKSTSGICSLEINKANKYPEAKNLAKVTERQGMEFAVNPMQLQATYIRNDIASK